MVGSGDGGGILVHYGSEGRDKKVLCIELGNEVVTYLHDARY